MTRPPCSSGSGSARSGRRAVLGLPRSTGGNPFLLESRRRRCARGRPRRPDRPGRLGAGAGGPVRAAAGHQIGAGASGLARALAVFGGPARLRHAAALAGLDLRDAARLADSLRAADVLAPGSMLEFGHPIVRAAIYESIPPGERALAHGQAARCSNATARTRSGTRCTCCAASRPAISGWWRCCGRRPARPAGGAPGHGRRLPAPGAGRATGPGGGRPCCSNWGSRSRASAARRRRPPCPRRSSSPPARPSTRPQPCSARGVLGIWAHHASVTVICLDALAAGDSLDPVADNLEAELFANAMSTARPSARRWPRPSAGWRARYVQPLAGHAALFAATTTGRPARRWTGSRRCSPLAWVTSHPTR